MTTLNRDQIAGWREAAEGPRHTQFAVPVEDLAALCDMATRLLDLCEAEPVAWVDPAALARIKEQGKATMTIVGPTLDEVEHRTVPLIPRPESKP